MRTLTSCLHDARHSYLGIYAFHARNLSTTQTTQSSNGPNFGRPFTGGYEVGTPTRGPLAEAAIHGVPNKITPRKLKEHLDRYVVGQERSKKYMAVAVYNHYQRVMELERQEARERERLSRSLRERFDRIERHPVEDEFPGQVPTVDMADPESLNSLPRRLGEAPIDDDPPTVIEKSNILLIGPTGVGKTLIAKTMARILEVPFSISDCTAFTQAGYIGEDAEQCVHRLLQAADFDVARAEQGIIYLDEVDKIAAAKVSHGKDVSGEGVQQSLLKIIEGTTISITAKGEKKNDAPAFGSGNYTGGPIGGAGKGAAKPETYQVRTDNILFIFSGAFVGLDKIVRQRKSKSSMGFGAPVHARVKLSDPSSLSSIDGIDPAEFHDAVPFYDTPPTSSRLSSLNHHHNTPSATQPQHSSSHDHQPPNILDLATPADFQSYGLIPEFLGRIPIITSLSPLTLPHLIRILTEPRSSLIAQNIALFATYGAELRFTSRALHEIAKQALERGTGARGLRSVVERVLARSMFEVPGSSVKYVLVTGSSVSGGMPKKSALGTAGSAFDGPGVGRHCGYWARGQAVRFKDAFDAEEAEFGAEQRRERRELDDEDGRAGGAGTFEEYRAQACSGS